MASDLILTTAQAQAVYSAMCALKVVDGTRFQVAFGWKLVRQYCGRVVYVTDGATGSREEFADQDAFAAAYGLPVAAPDLVAALRVAYSDIQRLPGHTIDMLGRIEAAIEQATA